MFASLLIANRGEIACRIIATARRMGLRTIAVYSDADESALHVALADEARRIGPPEASRSYLDGEAIIAAALDASAEAIHPGYGFLAESASFADACRARGFVFVGPPTQAIRLMGRKDEAKAAMAKAGVAVVPGYDGADQKAKLLAREAKALGYPILLKAVAGGGGKGMRRVDRAGDFEDALAGARREAKAAFGDDRMLIEKFLARPRHIEVQVFADAHGNAIHLHERDCSVQRRHQKIIEEAPAPGMTDELRQSLGAAAVRAAKAIAYEGAGTVEFIADVSAGLDPDRLYFIEMNTRLQVEHPVTEMITGLDLVEWQLRVAAGETLPWRQDDIVKTGHAIEARLYAEDPAAGFLPSPGRLRRLRLPSGDGVRVDTGVREGDTVTTFYDPMIAKLIAHGHDRAEALERLSAALGQVEIAGIRHNAAFLRRILRHQRFRAGDVDTLLVDTHLAELTQFAPEERRVALMLAALIELQRRQGERQATGTRDPWELGDGWRLFGRASERVALASQDGLGAVPAAEAVLEARRSGDGWAIRIDGAWTPMSGRMDDESRIWTQIDRRKVVAAYAVAGTELDVMVGGATHVFIRGDALQLDETDSEAVDTIAAPLPGKIAAVFCAEGQSVAAGAPLLVLEAMKMEHKLVSPRAGVIARLTVAAGDQVEEGRELVRLEAAG